MSAQQQQVTTIVRPATVWQAWTGQEADGFQVLIRPHGRPSCEPIEAHWFPTEQEAREVAREFGPIEDEL